MLLAEEPLLPNSEKNILEHMVFFMVIAYMLFMQDLRISKCAQQSQLLHRV